MTHQHPQRPSPVEEEILKRFEQTRVPYLEQCRRLARARAAKCVECQDHLLAAAAGDARGSAAVFYLYWVVLVHQVDPWAAEAVTDMDPIPKDPFPRWLRFSNQRWRPGVTLVSERVADTADFLAGYDQQTRAAYLRRSFLLADNALALVSHRVEDGPISKLPRPRAGSEGCADCGGIGYVQVSDTGDESWVTTGVTEGEQLRDCLTCQR